ncbi:MAG: porin [Rhizobiales bacterium]|nr:porin [Hyphomicrobiales bacterium]
MKKSLLLGSAAALVIAPAAFAADLPVVEPVEYVKVCDAFGAGFHYIPGTETCLKFSGRVRTEFGIGSTDPDHGLTAATHVNDRNDTTFFNSNFELVVNASSMTEIGLLVGQFAISGSNEGTVSLGDAWITIGENILVGRETSRFDFGAGYGIYDAYYGDEGLNQFTFIMPFGNGFSATLGLEDARDRTIAIAQGNGAGVAVGQNTVSQAGMEIPDVVASLRISQGWGSAQVSGALHQLRIVDNTNSESDTDWGFAVEAGIELNVGSMTKIKVKAGYADGALHYIGGGSVGADMIVSVVGANTSILDTYSGYDVLAAVTHTIGDLSLSLTGQYVDLDDQAEITYVGATASYEVVENLTVALTGQYTDFDYNPLYTSANALALDHDDWAAKLRIQRSF